jgi:hypothetical protein
MSQPERAAATTLTLQQKILDALQGGARTWDELRAQTRVTEEGLGFAIGELLDMRKIWTGERGGVRVYGIERRRAGPAPRFAHPLRRAGDLHD